MEIAYTAHTETCTLLLDAGGICRSVLAASSAATANGHGRSARIPSSAEQCIGAQYVATLDVREPGGMLPLPKAGAQMLFARTEKNGRVTLIRTARVLRFEASPAMTGSGVHERKDVAYGDDDERTIPDIDPPTLANPERRSSLPPPRNSGVVPAGSRVSRTAIPPPPPAPRLEAPDSPDSTTRPLYYTPAAPTPTRPLKTPSDSSSSPTLPRRPSLVRVSAPEWELETRPFKRAAR
ncbi:MAG: hypothetical protein ACLQVI_27820 [Polyangiaceae bacterium]|jgi:hypothetical protein